jgi:hypothetical protein
MRRIIPSALHALAFGAACVLAACASGPARPAGDPAGTLHRFLAAVKADKLDDAYAILHPELRRSLSRERFADLARDNKRELLDLAAQLERVDEQVRVEAKVTTARGEAVTVVLEEGEYRIAGGVLDAHALATPLDAVSELRRALQRESLPLLMHVLSSERRAAWQAAFGETLARTADPLDLRVEIHGDTAIVYLTGGGEIHLRKEADRWHVHDVK